MSFREYVSPETCHPQLKEALDKLLEVVETLLKIGKSSGDDYLAFRDNANYYLRVVYTLWRAGYDVREHVEQVKEFFEDKALDIHEECSELLLFLSELGIINNEHLMEIIDCFLSDQSYEGKFAGYWEQVLFVLTRLLGTEHSQIELGVNYCLDQSITDLPELAWEIMILLQYGERYHKMIHNLTERLVEHINKLKLGQIAFRYWRNWRIICWALSMVGKMNTKAGENAKNYLLEHIYDKKTGEPNTNAILGLLYTDLGPKIPLIHAEVLDEKIRIRSEEISPVFLHTSPIYGDDDVLVREIYNKIVDMLDRAEKSVKVCTPYPDILYEKLVDLATIKKLDVKVISRPKEDMSRVPDKPRRRIAKSAIDILTIATKGHQTNPLVHARLLIVDDKEVLVSSADLNRDSLIDQYNAGIYTRDPKTVQNACLFFENLWKESVRMN